MNKKRFRLYDIYDGPEDRTKIGDGECAFALYEWHEDDGKYHRVHDWSY